MSKKIKLIFGAIAGVLGCFGLAFASFLVGKRYSDGQGSTELDDGNKRIGMGIKSSQRASRECTERIELAKGHLQRAREILQQAIEKGKAETDTCLESDGNK